MILLIYIDDYHVIPIMESMNKDSFVSKLIAVLKSIIDFKKFDQVFIEKFLNTIDHEFGKKQEGLSDLSDWLSETFQRWKKRNPSTSEAIFVCKFVGVLAQYEDGFQLLQDIDAFNKLTNVLQVDVIEKSALQLVYINILCKILNHWPGYNWIKTAEQWKIVTNLYFSSTNLYMEREGLNFIKNYIDKGINDNEDTQMIFQEIFTAISKYNETSMEDKKFNSVTLLLIKLMQSLLKTNILSENQVLFAKIKEVFDVQTFLIYLLENCKEQIILEEAAILQVLCHVAENENHKELLTLEDIPILEIMSNMLKRNQFSSVTRLAKFCQILWCEMRRKANCESKDGVHFIIVQLLPVLICIKPPDTFFCDLYIQKLFSITTIKVQKFCYFYRDEIKSKVASKFKDLALKSVLSVISNTEFLNLEEAVIIFQAMAYALTSFIPDVHCQEQPVHSKTHEKGSLCFQDTSLLSAVINCLCAFIKNFKITWPESLESLCLLKVTCILLDNAELSPVVVVQVFLLVKLAILNFMSPDLALLLNNTEDSSFDCLMPLLYKRLHDPNWEIRDSCLEVINAIAELSESKYPAFQQLLIEKDFSSLIVDIMVGDSESYVRASAIQALTTMMKIPALKQILFKLDVPKEIIKLLQNESEGIVRREAALMIKQIYLSLDDPLDETVSLFYEIMGYLTICDLHWEVKVNSLSFWEAVIQRVIADQGMIDGAFPKVTFSKEHKKIVTLTKDEVKLRLDKVLLKLSDIGCLYVLLLSLNDDCDMPVIKKSAQILSDLITTLKHYEVIKNNKNIVYDRLPMKRKNMVFDCCEKRKITNFIIKNSSDGSNEEISDGLFIEKSAKSDSVIDGIVNEKDINLLANICFQSKIKISSQKKLLLQEIKPEIFLQQIQNFELEKFLEDKQKWMLNIEVDLKSLVGETFLMTLMDETNIMDCY